MIGSDDRHLPSKGRHMAEAPLRRFWQAARRCLVGIIGVALITVAAVRLYPQKSLPETGVGPGTVSLAFLLVIVIVSLWGGFVASLVVSLIAVFCLNYYILPLVASLEVRNPLDIVATVTFLFTSLVITGMVSRVRQLTEIQLSESRRAEGTLQRSLDQLRALAARLQSAREDERTRVAREIHDELGQALTAIKLEFTALLRDLPAVEVPVSQRSQSILKLLDEAIQSIRRIATELRPGILDDLGLAAAAEWVAEEFQARTGIRCHLDRPDSVIGMDAESATALFRIVQESLTNVARHANASEVNIRLTDERGKLILEVRDNGRGIGEEQLSNNRSLGILGMRERVLLIGGELTISGSPGQGTTVRVRIPHSDGGKAGVGQ
jgi:signal transduction histidine kinase